MGRITPGIFGLWPAELKLLAKVVIGRGNERAFKSAAKAFFAELSLDIFEVDIAIAPTVTSTPMHPRKSIITAAKSRGLVGGKLVVEELPKQPPKQTRSGRTVVKKVQYGE